MHKRRIIIFQIVQQNNSNEFQKYFMPISHNLLVLRNATGMIIHIHTGRFSLHINSIAKILTLSRVNTFSMTMNIDRQDFNEYFHQKK